MNFSRIVSGLLAIEKLFITVSREAKPQILLFRILATTVIDHDGNSTTMEFSNAVTNSMVSDLLFRFDPPPDLQGVRPPGAQR